MLDEYWFLALQYAVQVSICSPSRQIPTPFFLQQGVEPDYRKIIPLFSAAHTKDYTSGQGNTINCQTMQCILVGNNPKSNGQLFHNPTSHVLSDLSIMCLIFMSFNLDYQG